MAHLAPILHDDALTRNLGDEEARILVEWMIDWAERFTAEDPATGPERIHRLWRRGRALARFVSLWEAAEHGAALQLAASEQFDGPLPNGPVDSCTLMQRLLRFESRRISEQAA